MNLRVEKLFARFGLVPRATAEARVQRAKSTTKQEIVALRSALETTQKTIAGIQTARDARRSFDAAAVNRLTADWFAPQTSGDAELRGVIRRIIARTRDLARNNDYVSGFNRMAVRNIIGSAKFDLRMDVHDIVAKGAKRPDDLANRLIEGAWLEWSKRKNCTPAGDRAWRAVKAQALVSCITDGAVLFRHVRGRESGNRFGYAVQLIEIDQLDLDRHENLADGGTIRFGIEKNASGRIRAFHIFTSHPGDDLPKPDGSNRESTRIKATDMGILQLPGRISETISTPWLITCLTRLRHLGAYEEAEVIAARVGACKGGFFTKKPDTTATYAPDAADSPMQMDAEPGHFEELPAGIEFTEYNPQHPNTAFAEFRKAMLRGIGASRGVSYNSLGNDLSDVNYSSGRIGLLEEREEFKILQVWFAEDFEEIVFEEALLMFLTTGEVNLPLAKFDKFNQPVFKARRWAWVDPLKDITAAEMAIALRLTSRRREADQAGADIEDILAENRDDEALAKKLGVSLVPPDPTPSGSTQSVTTGPAGGNGGAPAEPDDDEADD